MAEPNQRQAELLEYLREIGFSHSYVRAPESSASAEPAKTTAQSQSTQTVGADSILGLPHGSAMTPAVVQVASAEDRAARLAQIDAAAQSCTRCGLAQGRKTVVFGSGSPNADLMFVGEGPGAQEDIQGLPFVGPAGELLTKIIGAIDFKREQVYIANIVKCRPPGNRNPLPDESAACREYLESQIDLVRPRVLVALGRVAAQNLLDSTETLGRMRGRWYEFRGVPTRVTYHPAALLRNASYKRPTWEDMQIVRDFLLEPRVSRSS